MSSSRWNWFSRIVTISSHASGIRTPSAVCSIALSETDWNRHGPGDGKPVSSNNHSAFALKIRQSYLSVRMEVDTHTYEPASFCGWHAAPSDQQFLLFRLIIRVRLVFQLGLTIQFVDRI